MILVPVVDVGILGQFERPVSFYRYGTAPLEVVLLLPLIDKYSPPHHRRSDRYGASFSHYEVVLSIYAGTIAFEYGRESETLVSDYAQSGSYLYFPQLINRFKYELIELAADPDKMHRTALRASAYTITYPTRMEAFKDWKQTDPPKGHWAESAWARLRAEGLLDQ